MSDASRATPRTTYGATKACCELLLTDYSRRGFVDGRGVRLPAIIVRAGKPNAATTGCYSGIIREPLNGVDVELPIAKDVLHAVTGTRNAIQALQIMHDVSLQKVTEVLGYDRTVFVPAVALSLGDLEGALKGVVSQYSRWRLGRITYKVNDFLSKVVAGFPTKIDAQRALDLGIPAAPTAETLVRDYIADFPEAVKQGIRIVPSLDAAAFKPTLFQNTRVAVVTGGGSGIGRAVAQRLSKGGWVVVLAGRRLEKLQETASLLSSSSALPCLCVPTDVSDQDQVQQLFNTTELKYGHVDLLFNNAGINSPASRFDSIALEDFERVLSTNVTGPFLCAKAAMNLMKKAGNGGRIINNGSISAHTPRPHSATYTTSKHALLGLTKCIALDGQEFGVACGQIDFGNVVSELLNNINSSEGALQPNGTKCVEPTMYLEDAAESVWTMANLPFEANVLNMTLMATNVPFVGRG